MFSIFNRFKTAFYVSDLCHMIKPTGSVLLSDWSVDLMPATDWSVDFIQLSDWWIQWGG